MTMFAGIERLFRRGDGLQVDSLQPSIEIPADLHHAFVHDRSAAVGGGDSSLAAARLGLPEIDIAGAGAQRGANRDREDDAIAVVAGVGAGDFDEELPAVAALRVSP